MWIRSQDGTSVVALNNSICIEYENTIYDDGAFIVIDGMRMGEYSTEDRAIEALDEVVQEILDGTQVFQIPE